jgi:ribosomal RNA assembly protein
MRTIPVESVRRIKKATPSIESKIKVRISFGKDRVHVDGKEVDEYLVSQIVRAVDLGFDVEDALLLLKDNFILEFIDVKSHTRRKNLKDVRARLIGTDGKAKRTIENLTGAVIVISDNCVGVIGEAKSMDATLQAIESLIQGSKHGNVFSYLEKQNRSRVSEKEGGLGLKGKFAEMDESLDEDLEESEENLEDDDAE